MRVAAIPWTILTVVGLVATLSTGFLIVRGPFFGGPTLDPLSLLVATGGFIAAIIALAFGGSKLARVVLF
ncbi:MULTISPECIES: hypothetical protein [Haloprofundus]|uniref:hypothetical protein n=1 Tax=Haloprofundus TaxID=1911573 RepID=UPI000E451DEA|nr:MULTISPECIES: hypothetical protein [Haloprofundus]QCJ48032.1 hypothetical protein FCF25_13285 [Haloprofundus sp. MHR1]